MSVTIQAHDFVMAALALLGVVLFAAGALALLVRVLGRKLPDVLEAVAAWALVEAAGLRARHARKAELAGSQPRLELRPAAPPVELVEVTE
jgi:hypothetical protein